MLRYHTLYNNKNVLIILKQFYIYFIDQFHIHIILTSIKYLIFYNFYALLFDFSIIVIIYYLLINYLFLALKFSFL